LCFIEASKQIPFGIERVYFIYDVPAGSERGGHAHKKLQQLIIAVSGSFDIHLDDGIGKKTIPMDRGNQGLYICPMIWREIDNFSSGAVCLVLASYKYDEEDYFRDYKKFVVTRD
jgi:uncharacterized RmlC-like cupin family protein